jgi:hypothetical protein
MRLIDDKGEQFLDTQNDAGDLRVNEYTGAPADDAANDVCGLRRRKLRRFSAAVATSREGHR